MTPDALEATRAALYVLGFVPLAGLTVGLVKWVLGKVQDLLRDMQATLTRVEHAVNEQRADLRLLQQAFEQERAENKAAHGNLWERVDGQDERIRDLEQWRAEVIGEKRGRG